MNHGGGIIDIAEVVTDYKQKSNLEVDFNYDGTFNTGGPRDHGCHQRWKAD